VKLRRALAYAGFLLVFAAAVDGLFGAFARATGDRPFRIEHPYYHHGLRPLSDVETSWGGRRYAMRTDSLGFRAASAERVDPRSPGRRVVLIGDSTVEGLGVAYPDTTAGLLAARGRDRGIEVRNAGVVSYSPKLYYLRTRWLLEHDGLAFERLVVFVDVSDIHDEVLYESFVPRAGAWPLVAAWWRGHSLVWQLLDRHVFARAAIDNHFRTDAGIDLWMRTVDAYRKPVGDPDAGRWEWTYDEGAYHAFGEHGLALADANMTALAALCRARSIELAVVVYPSPYQIFANDRESRQATFWRRFCEREGVAFVDLFPVFVDPPRLAPLAAYQQYFLPDDVHWNEAGHALVADRVEEVVLGGPR